MNVSVVIPVLNEEESIVALLESLKKQTYQPKEVIVVDGGSTDKTLDILHDIGQEDHEFHLTVIEKKGANRSVSRNLGIEKAKSEFIAVTDAGCVAKSDWLEKLIEPVQKDDTTEVVAGFYDPGVKSWWQDILADFTSIRPWQFDENTFLPSSRSLLFTKVIWKKVEGYPEHLNTCEDLVFAERLKKEAKHWHVAKDAQVIWDQPNSLSQLNEKVMGYAEGDLQAEYERHVNKIHKAKWRIIVLLGLALPLLYSTVFWIQSVGISFFALYIVGSWSKHVRMLKYPLGFLMIPVVQLVVDFSLLQALVFHMLNKKR